MNTYFVEVTDVNCEEYLGKILNLQEEVFENLKAQGKEHLFFKSSEDEIRSYIYSKDSIVAVLTSDEDLISVCYFTFNHSVYNDLTLYIKNSKVYKDFVISSYNFAILISKYVQNLKAYKAQKENGVFSDELLKTIREKWENKDFFENDPLRQEISKKLVEMNILNDDIYPWLKSTDFPSFYENLKDLAKEYDEFISYFEYSYITEPFSSKSLLPELAILNDKMVGELDTYFSAPKYRNKGYASMLINWAIEHATSRRHIFALSATVHPENTVSQHILSNLGFDKFCTVERRKNVPRNVMFKLLS